MNKIKRYFVFEVVSMLNFAIMITGGSIIVYFFIDSDVGATLLLSSATILLLLLGAFKLPSKNIYIQSKRDYDA